MPGLIDFMASENNMPNYSFITDAFIENVISEGLENHSVSQDLLGPLTSVVNAPDNPDGTMFVTFVRADRPLVDETYPVSLLVHHDTMRIDIDERVEYLFSVEISRYENIYGEEISPDFSYFDEAMQSGDKFARIVFVYGFNFAQPAATFTELRSNYGLMLFNQMMAGLPFDETLAIHIDQVMANVPSENESEASAEDAGHMSDHAFESDFTEVGTPDDDEDDIEFHPTLRVMNPDILSDDEDDEPGYNHEVHVIGNDNDNEYVHV
jgi:hypothetical protein